MDELTTLSPVQVTPNYLLPELQRLIPISYNDVHKKKRLLTYSTSMLDDEVLTTALMEIRIYPYPFSRVFY
ncbi:hypothetical protein IWX76_000345 [Pedobacter sp. CAN_A7]